MNDRLLVFTNDALQTLYTRAQTFANRHGCYWSFEQLYTPGPWRDGIPKNQHGQSKTELLAVSPGAFFIPSGDHTDNPAPLTLQIVGDHGVYCMPNVALPGTLSDENLVIHAQGCNPDCDEDFYAEKRRVWGEDDGTFTLPETWCKQIMETSAPLTVFVLSDENIEMIFM